MLCVNITILIRLKPMLKPSRSGEVMHIPIEIKKGWEQRFPALTGRWTHWKITGDGGLLEIVEGVNLRHALEVIENNYGRFEAIRAIRVTVDDDSSLLEEERQVTEISRFKYDERIRQGLARKSSPDETAR